MWLCPIMSHPRGYTRMFVHPPPTACRLLADRIETKIRWFLDRKTSSSWEAIYGHLCVRVLVVLVVFRSPNWNVCSFRWDRPHNVSFAQGPPRAVHAPVPGWPTVHLGPKVCRPEADRRRRCREQVEQVDFGWFAGGGNS